MVSILTAAAVMGLLGNFHCLAMCGPLALSMSPGSRGPLRASVYHSGRILVYTSMGLLAGSLGYLISWAGFQQGLSITIGTIMFIHGLSLFLGKGGILKHAYLFLPNSFVQKKMKELWKSEKMSAPFILGMFNGLLPCGLVYLALAGAAVTPDMLSGGLFMAVFGLSTLPVFIGIELSKKKLSKLMFHSIPKMIPVLFILFGILLFLRGADLGIPYISPSLGTDGGLGSCCSHP